MKITTVISVLTFLAYSCGPGIKTSSYFSDKSFKSLGGEGNPQGNRFIFRSDSSFHYVARSPFVFVSSGKWAYSASTKELILHSDPDPGRFSHTQIDTVWIDLSNKRISVKSKRMIVFEGLEYYVQENISQ